MSSRPPGRSRPNSSAGPTDVLCHADARDRVERPAVDIAVVLDPDLDSIANTLIDGPAPGVVSLFLRQRDADGLNPTVASSVADEGSPAATRIEDTHPRFEAELACDEVVLGLLGLLQTKRGTRGGTG